jgi:ABC-type multidrug transport system fused ATPase/permease subunit
MKDRSEGESATVHLRSLGTIRRELDLKPQSNPWRDFAAYWRVFRAFVGWQIYPLLALTLLATFAEGFGILMVLPLLNTVEGSSLPEGGVDTPSRFLGSFGIASVTGILMVIASAFVLKGLMMFVAKSYSKVLLTRLTRDLRIRLVATYEHMDYLYYTRGNTGHFVNMVQEQTQRFNSAFSAFIGLISGAVVTMGLFTLALLVAWQFALMAIAIGLLLLMLFRRVNSYVRDLSRTARREEGHFAMLLVQSVHAFKYLLATDRGGPLRREVVASIRRLSGLDLRREIAGVFTQSIREPLSVLFLAAIVAIQINLFAQSLAAIAVSILLFHRGLNAMLGLQPSWQRVLNSIGAVEAVRDEFVVQARHCEPDGEHEAGPLTHAIELRRISFCYDEVSKTAVDDVSMMIPARHTVAFVGKSGAGKSTIVDMICLLLRPQTGELLIDHVPAHSIKLSSWRRHIGYVPQDIALFHDTIANNIGLWSGMSTDRELLDRVHEAAKSAHIAEFIESLPDGYDTVVGDRGISLSGGQRQRLALARELFHKPSLLILDEATSALDSESERAIQESIDRLRGRITVIIVAHRLATVRNADRVFVFDEGRLVEQGGFAELIERRDSRFGRMAALQRL